MRRLWVLMLFLVGCRPQERTHDLALQIASVGPLAPLTASTIHSDTVLLTPLVYDPFLLPAAGGGWRSSVADQWDFASPGQLRIKLRAGLRFSDGSPVVANDVVSSFAAAGLKAEEHDGWFTVRPINDSDSVDALVMLAILTRHTDAGDLGTGPFRSVRASSSLIRVERSKPIPGRVNVVELIGFEDSRQAFSAVLKGNANALLSPDPGVLELVGGVPGLQIVRAPSLHAVTINFNSLRIPATERRQLVASLDSEALARAYGANCVPTHRKHPADAELPAGRPLTILSYDQEPASGRAALAVRRQLGDRGGTVQVLPVVELLKRLQDRDFDVMVAPMQVWPQEINASIWHSHARSNLFGYSNSALDEAFHRRDWKKANAILQDDAPFFAFCRRERVAIVDSRFKNVTLGPYDMLESLPNWEVSQ